MSSVRPSSNKTALAAEFAALWMAGSPPDVAAFLGAHPGVSGLQHLQVLLIDQKERWCRGIELRVEDYLGRCPGLALDDTLLAQLVVGEFEAELERGLSPRLTDYIERFPNLRILLTEALVAINAAKDKVVDPTQSPSKPNGAPVPGPAGAGKFDVVAESLPERFGRYVVKQVLGRGGFGWVYLGLDQDLHRQVAIKVPRADRFANAAGQEQFFAEAQLLARLEHPGIVPVYDVGRTEDGRCFIVSKYIDGSDLARRIREDRPPPMVAVRIIAEVAEALAFAHAHRIVHRDVKPANILLDVMGRAYIADFGIALKDEDLGVDVGIVGTLAYMSPEQLRGEGHLVDGRSDVFSLGVVLYELITGVHPFSTESVQRAINVDPRPPRQLNNGLPKELERVCLKALARRAADRYSTALDLATDLRNWMQQASAPFVDRALAPTVIGIPSKDTDSSLLRIIPKGLRAFDAEDANFFLELIPGPRERDGLPEIIHFWKTRIESRDPEKAFRVGLIYGPSGCGKSSLLRAGLLPRLESSVNVIYVDATSDQTESMLLQKLQKMFPTAPRELRLTDFLARIRRGEDLPADEKLLLVFDQFEQYLHARRADSDSELVPALRQCDGVRLQCILGVRDDFWMGITQFMHELEVELVPGQNVAPMQLLNKRHARKILQAYGREFGALAGNDLDQLESRFVDDVIDSLAEQDRIIPVRLALLAEMTKDRTWHPDTLVEIGGVEGIGVAFLEDTFSSSVAMPEHRVHQRAARAVLKSLLPEESGVIKGDMQSRQELLDISGYDEDPGKFETLMRILDNDLRLITPTESPSDAAASTEANRYYHLTHDYLVPPLREWLTRKQRETRRGRAELRLAECASNWKSRPTTRNLPTWWEWVGMMTLLPASKRSQRETRRNVMHAATRYYAFRMSIIATILLVALSLSWYGIRLGRARSLVQALSSARISDVPMIANSLASYPMLSRSALVAMARNTTDPASQLRGQMALLPRHPEFSDNLLSQLLQSPPSDFPTLLAWLDANRSTFKPSAGSLEKTLGSELDNEQAAPARRIRAGMALATFDPSRVLESTTAATFLTRQLVQDAITDPACVEPWTQALLPIQSILIDPLKGFFSNESTASGAEGLMAAAILCKYVGDQPHTLAELLLNCTPAQHRILISQTAAWESQQLIDVLQARASANVENANLNTRMSSLKQRANARVLLLLLGQGESAMQALHAAPDPTEQTYVEVRLSELAAAPDELLHKLSVHQDADVRATLLRVLGGMDFSILGPELRSQCVSKFQDLFQRDVNPGVHSAAEWALRTWGEDKTVRELSEKLQSVDPVDGRNWYVNSQGHTMMVFQGPIEFLVGSPEDEQPKRDGSDEQRVQRTIPRTFAVSTCEITVEQFLRFNSLAQNQDNELTSSGQCPAVGLTWHQAAQYCVWLSRKEDMPKDQICYEPVENALRIISKPEHVHRSGPMQPFSNYLERTGYRLITEAEWEYVCRAGTTTAFSWGLDPAMADHFAWHISNSRGLNQPIGLLRPNAYGLFDMHGNVAEWIHNAYNVQSPEQIEGADVPDLTSTIGPKVEDKYVQLVDGMPRVTRGGSNSQTPGYLRSANRNSAEPRNGLAMRTGFRIARTISPDRHP